MKRMTLAGWIMAGLLMSGSATALLAQNCPGRGKGNGYGGPPQSAEERAARQAACLEKNGGVCSQGGPRVACQGKGQGQGNGYCRGLRDGTGPRNANGTCPQGNIPQQRGR